MPNTMKDLNLNIYCVNKEVKWRGRYLLNIEIFGSLLHRSLHIASSSNAFCKSLDSMYRDIMCQIQVISLKLHSELSQFHKIGNYEEFLFRSDRGPCQSDCMNNLMSTHSVVFRIPYSFLRIYLSKCIKKIQPFHTTFRWMHNKSYWKKEHTKNMTWISM